MVKSNSESTSEKTALKKGAWSSEEDRKLIHYIKKYKIWNWSEMSKAAGLARSGKSCRLRWVNYLRPDIKHGNFSNEEVQTILTLHETLGNRWATIASRLPGRTDNEVKNYWHTHLKKRLNYNTNTTNSAIKEVLLDDEIGSPSTLYEPKEESQELEKSAGTNTIVVESPQPMSTDDFPGEIGHEEDQNNNVVASNNITSETFGLQSLCTQQQLEVEFDHHNHGNGGLHVAQDYSTDDFPRKIGHKEDQNSNVVASDNITSETFGLQSLCTQQQLEVEFDHHNHGNGGLHVAQDFSLAATSLFEPRSLVGPSGSEMMWQQDQSMWTYDYFCEDVCNDWLDYMDPIF